jgi:hypothetical protein
LWAVLGVVVRQILGQVEQVRLIKVMLEVILLPIQVAQVVAEQVLLEQETLGLLLVMVVLD